MKRKIIFSFILIVYYSCNTKFISVENFALEKQLIKDSKNSVPPFGAESIQMAKVMGKKAAKPLLRQIQKNDSTAFLALEALKKVEIELYNSIPIRRRMNIYVSELKKDNFYNAWGVPGYHLTETSKSIINLKEEAILFLVPLLDDTRKAILSGSSDATISKAYQNRVCDYVWVFIMEIKQRKYYYPKNPLERDDAIKVLKMELNSQ